MYTYKIQIQYIYEYRILAKQVLKISHLSLNNLSCLLRDRLLIEIMVN